MKNKGILSVAGVFLILAIASCSTGNKYSKLSYGGGWAESTETAKTNEIQNPKSADVQSTSTESIASEATSEVMPVAEHKSVNTTNLEKNGVSKTQTATTKTTFKQKVAKNILQKKMKNSPNAEVDNKLLLVIICLLGLPWLAVLLYDGVSSNFWITLLLWFLFILPGVIYGLLVVLDVI